ncbi:MAG TPA: hypothetical protein VES73_04410, partial [Lamprocystis sp. (in: g-proteobacteria)]|nr:hypothetical protein [Lamprocystis sp. (in: g-proteobacteria)]
TTAVRTWVSPQGTRDAMLAVNPPIRDRICYRQDALPRPFAGWNTRYCDAFLDPLRFIDTLSRPYTDADEHAMEQRSAGVDVPRRQRALIDFIDHGGLALACRFMADGGVTDEHRWCITAQRWRTVPAMADELNNRLGIIAADILPAMDRSRVYLLALQTGVAAVNLERET